MKFIGDHAAHLGMDVDFIDTSDEDALDQVTSDYDLVFIETPSNPWLKVTDMATSENAFQTQFWLVDSTAATPMLTKPIVHGADIVVHSATKALNGHSGCVGRCFVLCIKRRPVDAHRTKSAGRWCNYWCV
jgi:cystathionine gamma-synthase